MTDYDVVVIGAGVAGLTKVFEHRGKELVHGAVSAEMPVWNHEKQAWGSVRDRYSGRKAELKKVIKALVDTPYDELDRWDDRNLRQWHRGTLRPAPGAHRDGLRRARLVRSRPGSSLASVLAVRSSSRAGTAGRSASRPRRSGPAADHAGTRPWNGCAGWCCSTR